MFYKFLAALIAASALIYLGSLSVWVVILAFAIKALLAVLAASVLGATGFGIWRLYQKTRSNQTPRLTFKTE